MLIALWASARLNSTFKKYSNVFSVRGITGAEAARRVLDSHGLYDVRIEHVNGSLTDHYDPTENVLRLSDSVYASTSTAAIGVACHEVGHAIQHADGYLPIRIRKAIIPITNIGSRLGIYLFMIGLLITAFVADPTFGELIATIGIVLFSFTTVFQLVTLPTEYDASRRAVTEIERTGILTPEELHGAKKVLGAAALTYVAALAVSITQLLRLLLILGRSSGRRD